MDFKKVLSSITPLQQLLEDINFQRTKELRNLMKDGKEKRLFNRRPIIDFSPVVQIRDLWCCKGTLNGLKYLSGTFSSKPKKSP